VRRHRRRRHRRRYRAEPRTLAEVCPGAQVRVIDLKGLSAPSRAKLLALGICPGRCVEVIRHSPVTLVRVEHSELALEAELASGVKIELVQPATSAGHSPNGAR
jgi:Fe2+ transport system protein FeoA